MAHLKNSFKTLQPSHVVGRQEWPILEDVILSAHEVLPVVERHGVNLVALSSSGKPKGC